jgi:hypothetical protein
VHDDERECSVFVEDYGLSVPDGVPDAQPELTFKSFYQQIPASTSLPPADWVSR